MFCPLHVAMLPSRYVPRQYEKAGVLTSSFEGGFLLFDLVLRVRNAG